MPVGIGVTVGGIDVAVGSAVLVGKDVLVATGVAVFVGAGVAVPVGTGVAVVVGCGVGVGASDELEPLSLETLEEPGSLDVPAGELGGGGELGGLDAGEEVEPPAGLEVPAKAAQAPLPAKSGSARPTRSWYSTVHLS